MSDKKKAAPKSNRKRPVVGLSEHHFAQLEKLAKKNDDTMAGQVRKLLEAGLVKAGMTATPPKGPRKNAAKPKVKKAVKAAAKPTIKTKKPVASTVPLD